MFCSGEAAGPLLDKVGGDGDGDGEGTGCLDGREDGGEDLCLSEP